ncbi:hypothetical protein LR48_Vigan02g265700 [Vigna angularis]|uniref:Uncharacterized protein n=1 Tax=Phaseolus angularis TaxID=3914 RepID=A0A0L9U1G9_PHAAN|nr:hypothetical protein LR48_Vigan02g265700 [Vigna angularis]
MEQISSLSASQLWPFKLWYLATGREGVSWNSMSLATPLVSQENNTMMLLLSCISGIKTHV